MLGVNSGWIGMLGDCIVGRLRTCSRLVYITRFSRSFCRVDFYRPQRTCGKVMFLHLCVILFTGGSLSRGVSVKGERVSVRETPLYGNVRAVRILLECILVTRGFTRARKSLVYKAQCRGCCRCYICVIHFITIQLVFRSLRPKLSHLFTNMIKRVFSEPDCWMLVSSVIVLRDVRFVKRRQRPFHIHHFMC